MSDEYVWSELRDPFTQHVGNAPSAELEARVIEVFEHHPRIVVEGIDHVRDRFDRGLVRSPWPVLAKHVEEARDAAQRSSEVRATDKGDRGKRIAQAEQWMRSAGIHFDLEREVVDELFGDFGRLKAYAQDEELVERMCELWRRERPRGVRVEREAEERAATYRAGRAALRKSVAAPPTATDRGASVDEPWRRPLQDELVGAAPATIPNPFLDDDA